MYSFVISYVHMLVSDLICVSVYMYISVHMYVYRFIVVIC